MVLLNTADAMFLGRDPHVPDAWRSHFGFGYEQPLVVGQHISLPADAPAGGLAGINPWWPAPNGQAVRLEVDIDLTSGWARGCQAFTSSGVDALTPGQHTIVHEWVADHQWPGVEVGPGTEVDVLEVRRYIDGVFVGWWPGDIEVLEVYRGTVKVWPWLPPKPPAITGTYGAVGGTSSVTVSWASQPQATQGYVVYRDGVRVAWLPPGTNSWTNTGLTPNTAYTYRVAGISEGGVGPMGNQVSVRTAAIPIPTLVLTPSATSGVEVHFTTVTFTLAVTSNRGEGSYMLQRQLPNQGWADVSAISPDAPLGFASAIPAGVYEIGWWGATAYFRVKFTGSGAQAGVEAYSPQVSVSFVYRSRTESISVRTAACASPSFFMQTVMPAGARVEFNVHPSLNGLISSATFHTTGSNGYYATGDQSNPYVQWWSVDDLAQSGGVGGGPVGLGWAAADWMYADNVWGQFSNFGWRCCGYGPTPNPVWGVGVTELVGGTITINYVDGYRQWVYAVGGPNFDYGLLIG